MNITIQVPQNGSLTSADSFAEKTGNAAVPPVSGPGDSPVYAFENAMNEYERDAVAARYDASQTTPDNQRHWSMADNMSADAANNTQTRTILRSRSRYEVANNSYARGVVKTLAGDCIGTGPRLNIRSKNERANRQVERAWADWSDAVSLPEKLRTLRTAKCVDGEAFCLLSGDASVHSPVKLNLYPVESDRIHTPWQLNWQDYHHRNLDGVVIDLRGNPTEYFLATEHPGSDFRLLPEEYVSIAPEDMVHWFTPDRPEQHRGIPEFTPALELFAELRRYTLAVLAAAETAADFTAVITSTSSQFGGDFKMAPPFKNIPVQKRMFLTLPYGYEAQQFKPEEPCSNYADFKREILGEIARCLEVPVNVITGDSSRHNYSSGRLDHQVYHRSIRIEQHSCEKVVLRKIFDRWMREYYLANIGTKHQLPKNFYENVGGLEYFVPKINWFWDGFPHVDPQKEASAASIRLENGTSSLANECASTGDDWQTMIDQRLTEEAYIEKRRKELGLSLPTAQDTQNQDKEEKEEKPKKEPQKSVKEEEEGDDEE